MQYDHDLDQRIISKIEELEKTAEGCTFNKLKKSMKTNSRTLAIHLNKLESDGLMTRKSKKVVSSYSADNSSKVTELVDDRSIGIKRYCYLTESARLEKKLGILYVISKREKRQRRRNSSKEEGEQQQSPIEKARLFYKLLLLIAPTGALRYKKKKPEAAEPGDILSYDPKEKRYFIYEVDLLPGFGESDFLDDNIRLVAHHGGVFGYLSPSRKEIRQFFAHLQSAFTDPPLIRQIEDKEGPYKENRYALADGKLEELIFEIWELYHHVFDALEAKWRYLKSPNKKEYEWYRIFYGNRKASLYFTSLLNEKKSLIHDSRMFPTPGITDLQQRKVLLKKNGEKRFSEKCHLAKKQREKIEQQYQKTIEQYSSLIKPMINEIYSPLIK